MRRVLMISPHFPPDTNAASHRVRLLAPYLREFGWEPTVVAVDPASYEGRLDHDLAKLVPEWVRVVRVPAWPAHVTRRLGIGDLGLRAFTAIRRACTELLAGQQHDALFITIYPTYPALLGPALKHRFGVPFVLDYQDPWVGAWGREVGGGPNGKPDWKSRATRALSEQLEPRVVRAADALTAVSARTYEDVLVRVPDARPRACAAIPLGIDERDADALAGEPRPNRCFDEHDGLVHLCYVGTVLPKGLDVIASVLSGLATLRARAPEQAARLRLHFIGTSNQRSPRAPHRVVPIAASFGVGDLVTEIPARLDYLDALNVQAHAHALLLLGSSEPHYTPSKVFPALLAGKPIVAVYHAASSVVDILDGADATVLTFDEASPVFDRIGDLAEVLGQLATGTREPRPFARPAALTRCAARTLAGQLGDVFDTVAAARRCAEAVS